MLKSPENLRKHFLPLGLCQFEALIASGDYLQIQVDLYLLFIVTYTQRCSHSKKQWLPLHFRQSRDFESGAVGSLQSCEINREWKKWALRSAPSPLPGRLGGDQKEN